MPKRSSKGREPDENENAFRIVQQATAEDDEVEATEKPDPPSEKNPAAVELGRLGGLKGGKARAEKLSKKRRSEIAKKAAEARWKKGEPSDSG
ncbi:MAG: hypothetical protein WD737_03980 [Gemmatimonadota bacterium]